MAPADRGAPAIVTAIDVHDANAAARAMTPHLHGILESLLKAEASHPELFA
jgi:DNA-binding GntR family transcriptional regulator